MFTGLVQDIGRVERVEPGGMTALWISTRLGAAGFAQGESIAVSGACLTVVETRQEQFRVQASLESLRRTTLGALKVGARVNLERALTLSDRLGGHLVQGHVDGVVDVVAMGSEGGGVLLTFSLPPALAPYFIEKGSVALDGVSLTVNTLDQDRFSVLLIPETQVRTTLPFVRVGDRVNVEADLIGKYVARLHGLGAVGPRNGGLSEGSLRGAGFGAGPEGKGGP